jgi:hypothetical protein
MQHARSLLAVAAAALSITIGALGFTTPATAEQPMTIHWIISFTAIYRMELAGLSPTVASYFFDNSNTDLIEPFRESGYGRAIETHYFTSYATMSSTSLGAKVGAVIYDPEVWSSTPLGEQEDPTDYLVHAGAWVHSHAGVRFIYAPAANLTERTDNSNGEDFADYIAQGYAQWGSASSDVLDVQAEHLETTLWTPRNADGYSYASFVQAAASQATPPGQIFGGLSTYNPLGQPPTGNSLLTAVFTASSYVSGWWLNVPQNAVAGVDFLNTLYAELG